MTDLRTLSILLLAMPALSAQAEIYKCSNNKKGIPVYQNFSCETDSLGSSAAAVPDATPKTGRRATPSSRDAILVDPAGVTASEKHLGTTAPSVGMTVDEVRTIWGEPREKTREEFAKGDIETWKYADTRSIQFDHRRRVSAISW